jgi:2-polyprenyl-3-methyl-5-hydroxy-6-metoxy-1,4-benzoquinol methylase
MKALAATSSTVGERPKYWGSPDTNPALAAQLEFVRPDAKVLEVGSGPGHMTQMMAKRGCDIVVIEIDSQAASYCRRFCRRLIVADIETLDLEQELGGETFDVILLGDVLEHLRNAEAVLLKLHTYLTPSGFLVVSLPNIAHGSVRLALLQGHFAYQDVGILDKTHLRFFTLQSMCSLFESTGLTIQVLTRVRRGYFKSEVEFDPLQVDIRTLKVISSDPEAASYQYIVRAAPIRRASCPETMLPSRFEDATWSALEFKRDLAVEYKKRGFEFFWNKPRTFRRFFYRALALDPRPVTFLYLGLSFLPYRLLKPFDTLSKLFSREYMIPENRVSSASR